MKFKQSNQFASLRSNFLPLFMVNFYHLLIHLIITMITNNSNLVLRVGLFAFVAALFIHSLFVYFALEIDLIR